MFYDKTFSSPLQLNIELVVVQEGDYLQPLIKYCIYMHMLTGQNSAKVLAGAECICLP